MMKRYGVQKMVSLLLTACMALGLCTGAMATATTSLADFEVLTPVMDLVAAAVMYATEEPESVPGADGTLTVTFTDTLFQAAIKTGSSLGVTEAMLTDTNAQAAFLSQIFAAQLPQLEPVIMTDLVKSYIGFHPVTANTGTDGTSVQIIGEIYMANKPLAQMTEADFANVTWMDRAVFTFQSDATALNGFRLIGFSVGTDLAVEGALQGYFEEIVVEYVNANLGFSLLYPGVFTDEMLKEDDDGVSATLPDGSVSFFAKRMENVNGSSLSDYVSIIANGITGSTSSINETLQCGTVSYTTDEGYVVFDVYILTDKYIYQAELSYLRTMMAQYSMYNAYLENSFVADEVSVG